jgi:hypothetical protein
VSIDLRWQGITAAAGKKRNNPVSLTGFVKDLARFCQIYYSILVGFNRTI